METPEHVARLSVEGRALADAAARADLDAPIPTCPGWSMRDLVRHLGGVHRWAATYVGEARTRRMSEPEVRRITERWPADDGLVEWFAEGHARLVEALETADPDLRCWTFLAAPSPLAFWARRQAHETAIHRADAEKATGSITPFPPDFALDGIDELVSCFLTRPGGRLLSDPTTTLSIRSTDAPGAWLVRIGPEGVTVSQDGNHGDCHVEAPASELYLLLWNRRFPDDLDVRGDRSVLTLWRERARIRWG